MVKPNGLLVAVSSMHCCTYTSALSTWSSSTALLSFRLGNLISRKVSRLYAFSAYLDQTSLPSYATGVTTGSQEVCSTGSSRIFAHSMLVALCASNIRSTPLKLPAPTTDRDRTVSRRSEPSSRTALTAHRPLVSVVRIKKQNSLTLG